MDALDATPLPVVVDDARQRLRAGDVAGIGEVELLAVLLGDGVRARLAAEHLLAAAGGLARLGRGDAPFACALGSRWRRRALVVRAALELGRRAAAVPLVLRTPVRDPAQVWEHVRGRLPQLEHERFVVVLLDGRNRFLTDVVVSEGTLTSALVHPREVFAPALRAAAAALVLVHNHPSGDPTPSAEDVALTERLRQAGEIVGVRVLDHVVVAQGRWTSMAEAGRW